MSAAKPSFSDVLYMLVARAMPLIFARIPETPAAELGRLRATADDAAPLRRSAVGPRPAAWSHSRARPGPGASPVRDALGALPPLLVDACSALWS